MPDDRSLHLHMHIMQCITTWIATWTTCSSFTEVAAGRWKLQLEIIQLKLGSHLLLEYTEVTVRAIAASEVAYSV